MSAVARIVPDWLRDYQRGAWRFDVIAGLTLYMTAAAVEEIEAREVADCAKSPKERAADLLRAVLGDDRRPSVVPPRSSRRVRAR